LLYPATLSTASLEYVRATVSARESGATVDPTVFAVALAFLVGGATPTSGDAITAAWETDATTIPATYWARCLVGPGGSATLAAGIWHVWVRVSASPEVPWIYSGQLKVI